MSQDVCGRGAGAPGSVFNDARRQGVERGAGAGGQPGIRAVQQAFPVLLFQTVFHALQLEAGAGGFGEGASPSHTGTY
ncbi:UNVERIFIED_CONTAM: hypothetical protein K2H54_010055 [Gekko kuhli]